MIYIKVRVEIRERFTIRMGEDLERLDRWMNNILKNRLRNVYRWIDWLLNE